MTKKRAKSVPQISECLFCGNPNAQVILAELIIKRKKLVMGFNRVVDVNSESDEEVQGKILSASKRYYCPGCEKEYFLLCLQIETGTCKDYARSLLNRTHLHGEYGEEEVLGFMNNEKIKKGDVIDKLTGVTAIIEKRKVYLQILFSKYYTTIMRKKSNGYVMIGMWFQDRYQTDGDFFDGG